MIRVYPASKLWHWEKWIEWEEDNTHNVKLTARWINVMRHFKTDNALFDHTTPEYAAKGWSMNIADIENSDYLVVFANDEILRGALIEVGVALANNIPIVLVGNSQSYSEWGHHLLVINHVPRLSDVLPAINKYKTGW